MKRSIIFGAIVLATSTGAQSQAPMIEEVIVTAQKRAESLQDVPIAISAFNQDMMKEAGIDGIDNVAQFTPGFSMTSYNKSTPQPYIRGIGSNTSGAGDDASVAMFVDEVYISRAGAYDSNLFDLERVEVLRGPQGTLYGKNVVGGALNITTRGPNRDELEGNFRLDVGNFDAVGLQAYLSGPLTDSVAAKISYSIAERDGFVDNTVTGNGLRDEDSQAARVGLAWDASDSVSVSWSADASKVRELGVGRVIAGEPIFAFPELTPSINDPQKTDSEGKTDREADGFTDRDIIGTTLKVEWERSYGTWTSVTGYRESDYEFHDHLVPAIDLYTELHLSIVDNLADEDEEQFSQEIRLASPADGGDLEWTVGLYYFQDDIDRFEEWGTEGLVAPGLRAQFDATNETRSQAVFGQVSYNLDDWRFTIGGRYTKESKDFTLDVTGFAPVLIGVVAPFSVAEDEDWDNFSGKASIDYMGIEDVMIYFSVSEGFKSGSFNSIAPTAQQAALPLDPELATQFELGLKSQWMDDRLQVNAVLFDIAYDDLQVYQTVGLEVFVDNAGKASSRGVELEFIVLPIEGLELAGSYAYLDATYDEYEIGGVDFSGNNLTRAPENTYTLSGNYTMNLADLGDLNFRVDYINQGKLYLTANNDEMSAIEGYDLLNARVGFESEGGDWELAIYGKNLSDEEYRIHGADLTEIGSSTTSDVMGDPRTYGLSFTYNL